MIMQDIEAKRAALKSAKRREYDLRRRADRMNDRLDELYVRVRDAENVRLTAERQLAFALNVAKQEAV